MHEAPQHLGNQGKGGYLPQCWGFSQKYKRLRSNKKISLQSGKGGKTHGRKDAMLTVDALAKVQGGCSHQKA